MSCGVPVSLSLSAGWRLSQGKDEVRTQEWWNTSHHFTAHHITSHHITSHAIMSQCHNVTASQCHWTVLVIKMFVSDLRISCFCCRREDIAWSWSSRLKDKSNQFIPSDSPLLVGGRRRMPDRPDCHKVWCSPGVWSPDWLCLITDLSLPSRLSLYWLAAGWTGPDQLWFSLHSACVEITPAWPGPVPASPHHQHRTEQSQHITLVNKPLRYNNI